MTAPVEKGTRRAWGRYLFLVGLALLLGLGWYFGFEKIAGQIGDARPLPLVAMTGLIVAGFWIRAWKWHYALGSGGHGVFLFFAAKTAGNWTPGRAGELAPLLHPRFRSARTAAWIGLDRIVEVAWTLALGLLGAVAYGMLPVAVAGIVLAAGCAAAVALWLWWRKAGTVPGTAPVETPGGHGVRGAARWRGRLLGLLRRLRVELRLFGSKMPLVMLSTMLAKVTDIYAVILLCDAFGYDISFLLVCAARCAHGLVSAIPLTPDSTGVPYAAAGWLLHEYGGMPGETLTAALGLEVLVINVILLACFFAVSGIQRAETK